MCKGRMTLCTVVNQWTSDYGRGIGDFRRLFKGWNFLSSEIGEVTISIGLSGEFHHTWVIGN
jgi:hypothetical protein